MLWIQKQHTLSPRRRGFHLITRDIVGALPEIETLSAGLLQVFIQHTSASLTLNENASPEVLLDFETVLNRMVPEHEPDILHTLEGPDDMPAHIKASLMGPSLMLPIQKGRLALGTWQGIYLCEHRNHGGARKLMLTLQGVAG